MKVTIHPHVAAAKVRHLVPPAYRDDAEALALAPDSTVALLLFAHAPVRKALRRLGASTADAVVAVGTVFTEEALALLNEAGARVVAFRKARWTDASANARQL